MTPRDWSWSPHRPGSVRRRFWRSGAGTQVFTEGVGGAFFGTDVLAGDLAKGAAWVISLAVAEWVLRRSARRRPALSGAGALA